jgi:hypothetical protein
LIHRGRGVYLQKSDAFKLFSWCQKTAAVLAKIKLNVKEA